MHWLHWLNMLTLAGLVRGRLIQKYCQRYGILPPWQNLLGGEHIYHLCFPTLKVLDLALLRDFLRANY
jgi:hypothetical protein